MMSVLQLLLTFVASASAFAPTGTVLRAAPKLARPAVAMSVPLEVRSCARAHMYPSRAHLFEPHSCAPTSPRAHHHPPRCTLDGRPNIPSIAKGWLTHHALSFRTPALPTPPSSPLASGGGSLNLTLTLTLSRRPCRRCRRCSPSPTPASRQSSSPPPPVACSP